MTEEERQHIRTCRIIIIGEGDFIKYVKTELERLGFGKILNISSTEELHREKEPGIIIEYINSGHWISDIYMLPSIYTFDFIEGAGAIILFPDDEMDIVNKQDVRLWTAEYMSGYCAFWNISGSDWLRDAIPSIKEGKTNRVAQRTAAYLCARIAANIAVGRNVKHYPRFYLCRNLE
ncbi:MAG: hypothetical protein K2M11_08385 [Paramuribaculum sp.]|nr:hypothetical protein [Paramuribaculum sp.]